MKYPFLYVPGLRGTPFSMYCTCEVVEYNAKVTTKKKADNVALKGKATQVVETSIDI